MGCFQPPVACINIDPTTLSYIDAGGNGRITHQEVSSAVSWLFAVLRNERGISGKHSYTRVADLDDSHPDGKRMARACSKIISRSEAENDMLDLYSVRRVIGEIQKSPAGGAGVVLGSATPNGKTAHLISTIVKVTGGTKHPNGPAGVNAACLAVFDRAVSGYRTWKESAPKAISLVG